MTSNDGYRPNQGSGPALRSDVVDVYVFRRSSASSSGRPSARAYETEPTWPSTKSSEHTVEFLQLLRSGAPLDATWHPVMGHVERGETAVQTALREMREELGLTASSSAFLGMYALEQVHPFYIAAINAIILSPRFGVEVAPSWSPTINAEHSAHRWVQEDQVSAMFMWPGQKSACNEILREIVNDASLSREHLRVRDTGAR